VWCFPYSISLQVSTWPTDCAATRAEGSSGHCNRLRRRASQLAKPQVVGGRRLGVFFPSPRHHRPQKWSHGLHARESKELRRRPPCPSPPSFSSARNHHIPPVLTPPLPIPYGTLCHCPTRHIACTPSSSPETQQPRRWIHRAAKNHLWLLRVVYASKSNPMCVRITSPLFPGQARPSPRRNPAISISVPRPGTTLQRASSFQGPRCKIPGTRL
jgi:hypothetical protein